MKPPLKLRCSTCCYGDCDKCKGNLIQEGPHEFMDSYIELLPVRMRKELKRRWLI